HDVRVLTAEAGGWHERTAARAIGDGVYEADLVPPRAGSYSVAVECPSHHLPFHLSPQVALWVTEAAAAPKRER
ncbi:MAG TPA: hypothetical protein VGE98_04875, partial [Thermoanaerobaculia bacterium]